LEVLVLFPMGIIAMKYINTANLKGQASVSSPVIKPQEKNSRELFKTIATILAAPDNHLHW
jgi:hypothetical protein